VQQSDSNANLTGRFGWLEARHGQRLPAILVNLAVQFGLMFGLMTFYTWFRKSFFQQPPSEAFGNALDVIDAQDRLGLSVHRIELPLQRWVIDAGLIDLFNLQYRIFKPTLYIAALLCFLLAPVAFRRIRRIFLLTTAIAFPMYALYPLAPPRLMTEYGFPFLDTVAIAKGVSSTAGGTGAANLYAAMPSMHIGWTAVGALWIAAALPWKRIGLIIGGLNLTFMSLTVMDTGNHYWLDIAAGLAVVGVAVLIERRLPERIALPWPGTLRIPGLTRRTA
jgi:hypothetical protein